MELSFEIHLCNNVFVASAIHAILYESARNNVRIVAGKVFNIYPTESKLILLQCPGGYTKPVDVKHPVMLLYAFLHVSCKLGYYWNHQM